MPLLLKTLSTIVGPFDLQQAKKTGSGRKRNVMVVDLRCRHACHCRPMSLLAGGLCGKRPWGSTACQLLRKRGKREA